MIKGVIFQTEVGPPDLQVLTLILIIVETTNNIILTAKMINFKIPDFFKASRWEQIQRPDIDSRINTLQNLNSLCWQVIHPV